MRPGVDRVEKMKKKEKAPMVLASPCLSDPRAPAFVAVTAHPFLPSICVPSPNALQVVVCREQEIRSEEQHLRHKICDFKAEISDCNRQITEVNNQARSVRDGRLSNLNEELLQMCLYFSLKLCIDDNEDYEDNLVSWMTILIKHADDEINSVKQAMEMGKELIKQKSIVEGEVDRLLKTAKIKELLVEELQRTVWELEQKVIDLDDDL